MQATTDGFSKFRREAFLQRADVIMDAKAGYVLTFEQVNEGTGGPQGMRERIACAALLLPAGCVVTVDPPLRHYNAVEEAGRQGHFFGGIRGAEEGYLTSEGRFVARREGAVIADEIGQRERESRIGAGEVLLTEELWSRSYSDWQIARPNGFERAL